jgi:glutamate/aspartate transport system substrate-binding protein
MKPRTSMLLAGLLACVASVSTAQTDTSPIELAGTLAKVRNTGSIALGYRESSVPFSYLSPRGQPIGYSIDLCKLLVDAIGDAVGRTPSIRWLPVSSETRIAAVVDGQVDIECGSTTSNVERKKLVAFSPVIFVAGTKLLVRKGAPIRSFRDLAGKRVVVTAGTTNEPAMRELVRRFQIPMLLSTARDHAQSFEQLASGQADVFATDDVLLHGLVALNKRQAEFEVVGEFLSYEAYGLMYRKGDAQLAEVVTRTFRQLADDRELERRYERWFLRRLPDSDASLNLPMSPQLEAIVRMQSSGAELE